MDGRLRSAARKVTVGYGVAVVMRHGRCCLCNPEINMDWIHPWIGLDWVGLL